MQPSKSLRQRREQESVDDGSDIPGCGKAEHQPLHSRRVAAAGHRQCDREARASHAKEAAEQQQQRIARRDGQQQQAGRQRGEDDAEQRQPAAVEGLIQMAE